MTALQTYVMSYDEFQHQILKDALICHSSSPAWKQASKQTNKSQFIQIAVTRKVKESRNNEINQEQETSVCA